MKKSVSLTTAFIAIFLGGCATNPNLYDWGPYEAQVYSYFKNESPEVQIQSLEKHLSTIQAKGTKPPPGFYTHMGWVYAKIGKDTKSRVKLENEKRLYPESTKMIY